jgi:hypothetical protein
LLVSQVLVFLTAWLSVAPALHGGGHDQDCDPAVVVHDESQHGVAAASTDRDHTGDHCVACHLFRSSRHAVAWKFVPQALADSGLTLQVVARAADGREIVPLPARAPPSLV